MPSLVVPSRRRRTEDSDDDGASSRISGEDTPASRTSNGSKRIRLQSSDDEDVRDGQDGLSEEDSDEDTGTSSVPSRSRDRNLPANLTSRTNGSAVAPKPSDTHETPGFKPGAIVRIKLTDFVTYTSAEFFPGPRLNMVIGPNGTGKSTLVCAICLGLGWGPQVQSICSISPGKIFYLREVVRVRIQPLMCLYWIASRTCKRSWRVREAWMPRSHH